MVCRPHPCLANLGVMLLQMRLITAIGAIWRRRRKRGAVNSGLLDESGPSRESAQVALMMCPLQCICYVLAGRGAKAAKFPAARRLPARHKLCVSGSRSRPTAGR